MSSLQSDGTALAQVPVTWQRKLGNGVMIILITALAGPLVGLVVFAVGFGLGHGSLLTILSLLIYGLFFAHFMGGVQALLTGLTVALTAAWTQRAVPWWVGAISGLAAGIMIIQPQNFLDYEAGDDGPLVAAIMVITHLVAGGTTTWMTRPWQGVRPATSNLGS